MRIGFIIIIFFLSALGHAQHTISSQSLNVPDSLHKVLQRESNDSIKYQIYRVLYAYYEERNRDSALYYTNQRLALSKKNNKIITQAFDLGIKAYQLIYLGRFGEALNCLLEASAIVEDPKSRIENNWLLNSYPSPGHSRDLTRSLINHMFGHLMLQTNNTEKQILYLKEGRRIALSIDNHFRILVADMVLGSSYLNLNEPDSAMHYAREAEQYAIKSGIKRYDGYIGFVMGDVYFKKGDMTEALKYYQKALSATLEQQNLNTSVICYDRLIKYYQKTGDHAAILNYAIENLRRMKTLGSITATAAQEINIGTAYEQLASGYSLANQIDSAYKYQGLALHTKDSLFRVKIKNLSDFQNLSLDEQLRLQHIEQEKIVVQNKIRTYSMLAGLAVFMLIATILYRNNHARKKANTILSQQKEELQSALAELKATQSQLIHSEKMASLGELTAGIAHEIQNPLNFVNNFSEVSSELLDEMKQEWAIGNGQLAMQIADDVKQNLDKIIHHGKRAEAIVKSMLQHSRTSTGVKEPTDINALADEYIRLAYHGMRAKDKSFNVTINTDFDDSIGKMDVVPQDIGRVLLNLITNAFFAANEKTQLLAQTPYPLKGGDEFVPTVSITTKKLLPLSGGRGSDGPNSNQIQISIRDNGPGIPDAIKDKIFQPFFTTKPTGQGTGLGLSLSYDIVKAHGGEMKVHSKEGEFAEFIITLPL